MSEKEIIDKVMMIDQWKVSGDIYTQNELNAIGELLDLYNKEKEKNKKLEEELITESDIGYQCAKTDYDIFYISKDKIREKIKDLEDNMILFTNDKEKFNRYKYARDILEKLLEE